MQLHIGWDLSPASCTSIAHEADRWCPGAKESNVFACSAVAQRFLVDIPNVGEELRESVAHHMAFAHQSVTEASRK